MASGRRTTANLPTTVDGLRAWMKGATEGRAMFKELAAESLEEKCRACQQIRSGPKVLVVLRRLGNHPGAEVYAEDGVSIRFLELPDVPDDGEFGLLIEQLVEAKLPKSWRCLLQLPAKRIQGEVFRAVTLAEAVRHEETLGLIREMREYVDRVKGGKK